VKVLVPDRSCVAGGAEKLCASLFPELSALGVEVLWAAPEHRLGDLTQMGAAAKGARLLPVEWPKGNWRRALSALSRRLRRIRLAGRVFDRLHSARVRQLRREIRADHLLVPWILGEPLPEREKEASITAIVLDRNWTKFPENFSQSPDELDALLEAWMRRADRVIAISQDVAGDLTQRWPALAGKVRAIPLAASVRLEEERWQAAERQRPKEPVFYYPATVSPHKGHDTLLAAAERLAKRGHAFRLLLSGHGTDRLSAAPDVLGLGYASAQSVEETYLQATAVVLPSRYEGFGLPLAEALAHGTPVICSDLPVYREQIERLGAQESVRVAPVGGEGAFAEAMESALRQGPPSWERRVAIASAAARWTWRDVALAYRNLLCKAQ